MMAQTRPDPDIERLLLRQKRLVDDATRRFRPSDAAPRSMSRDERAIVRALICDLRSTLDALRLSRDETGRAMSAGLRGVSVSLAYLNTGRTITQTRRHTHS